MSKIICSYQNFLFSVHSIQKQISALDWKPDIILGVHRGGSVPAVYLSHMMNLPSDSFLWQTRDGGDQETPLHIIDDEISFFRKNVLIVDDINDTGETFQQIWDSFTYTNKEIVAQHLKFACLYQRNTSKFMAEIVANHVNTSEWVVFPWEQS